MWSRIVVLGAALAVAAAIASAGPAAMPTCKPGVSKVAGGMARTFCGTATARVVVNNKEYHFSGGQCDIYPRYIVVNIGTVVLAGAKKHAYFGLLLGKHPAATAVDPVVAKDGTYTKGLITVTAPGVRASVYNAADLEIRLTKNRRAGSFSGTGLGRKSVRGSFSC